GYVPVTWEEAVAALVERLRGILDQHGPEAIGGLLSTWLTIEELYTAATFLRDEVGTPHLDYRVAPVHAQEGDEAEDHLLRRTDKSPNTQGARLLGIGPGPGGWGIRQMLKAATTGTLKALLLFELDPWEEPSLRAELERSVDLELLVVWAVRESAAPRRADLVLPALGYAEKEGTIVNCAGRVQRLRKGVEPKKKILPLAEVLRRVGIGLGRRGVPWNPEEIWRHLPQEYPVFAGVEYEAIGPLGLLLSDDRRPTTAD
ncbi:MAG: molybdopterin-dependent oxidoreductase, partial [Candidatus Methylomirabilales bacterium]